MLYLYDRAIVDDIRQSINSENANPNVFISDAETYPGIFAQMQNDTITYPLILVERDENMEIITDLVNFTRAHKGIPAAFDSETNTIYNERALPVNIAYTVRILSTNKADVDELSRELFYKYLSMYYLTIQLPYESDRKIRFGIATDYGYGMKAESCNPKYLQDGSLYQTTLHFNTHGCVMLSYTGRHVERTVYNTKDIKIERPTGPDSNK